MDILVINGSPKGKDSITLQTVEYLKLLYPGHTFSTLHVGQRIKALEKDISPALEELKKAQLLLFCYPVYTFIAPYQLHRFIELVKQAGVNLAGKYAAQLSTSKHFYDVTAHRYIEDNCYDLGLKYIGGLSADMEDLLTEKGRKEARAFMDHLMWAAQKDIYRPAPAPAQPFKAAPLPPAPPAQSSKPGDIVVLTDCREDDTALQNMIKYFCAVSPRAARVVNIREYPFKGGCLGCFHCAGDGVCVYKDGFDSFLRSDIQQAQAIVYAFSISDHSMGAAFKLYDDRQFCNGHRTVTMGMPVGYIINGPYAQETNLQMIVEARAQVGGNFLAGVATAEEDPAHRLQNLADTLEYALQQGYVPPQNFYGVGGMKIFRDLIWQMQGMMKADHRFYKAHGQYDFPQKKRGKMLAMYLVGMLNSPKLRSKVGGKMTEGMLAPYKKVLNAAEKAVKI